MTSLFSLPTEVISTIIGLLPREQLPRLATVSRQFQTLVERRTFEQIGLEPWRATKAKQYLPKRMNYMRNIYLVLSLPLEADTLRDAAFYDAMFRDMILNVLPLLGSSPNSTPSGSNGPYHLALNAFSPRAYSKGVERQNRDWRRGTDLSRSAQYMDIWTAEEQNLPVMPTIRSFESCMDAEPIIYSPSTIIHLTRRMPNLEKLLVWSLNSLPTSDEKVKMRNDFLQSLHFLPSSLQELEICYYPDYAGAVADGESRGLRHCQSLKSLKIRMDFANFLAFIGHYSKPNADDWQCLKTLALKTRRLAPSGESYFRREETGFILDDDDDDDESDSGSANGYDEDFGEINNPVLEPTLLQLATLAKQMPRLERFTFDIDSEELFHFVYEPSHLYIYSHHVFEPGDSVLTAWADVWKASQPRSHNMKVTFESAGPRTRHITIPV